MNWIKWIIDIQKIDSDIEYQTILSFRETISFLELVDINEKYLLSHINKLLDEYKSK
jgi:hypothetical protein